MGREKRKGPVYLLCFRWLLNSQALFTCLEGSILLLLRSFFFPLFPLSPFSYISTQNRSQGSTVLIHWLLLGRDALDQVSGLCSGLDQEEALGRVRVSPHHPPHPPVRAWNGWGSGMWPVSRGGRGPWRKVPHRVWL